MMIRPKSSKNRIFPLDRIRALGAVSMQMRSLLDKLIPLTKQGLPQMYRKNAFVHTVRGFNTDNGSIATPEGDSLRYASSLCAGTLYVNVEEQRRILGGATAFDLIQLTIARAEWSDTGCRRSGSLGRSGGPGPGFRRVGEASGRSSGVRQAYCNG